MTLDFNSVSQLYTAHVLDAESGKTAVLNDISLSAAGGLEKSPDFLVEMGSKRSKCAAVLHEKRVNLFVDVRIAFKSFAPLFTRFFHRESIISFRYLSPTF